MDYFEWDEFIDPGKPYRCRKCGTLFEAKQVLRIDEEGNCVAVCPECGTRKLIAE